MDQKVERDYVGPVVTGELGRTSTESAEERNPYATGSGVETLTEIDGVAVNDLVGEFGSSLFVFSEKTLREKAKRMREAFHSRYEKTEFFWSVKTNYLQAICKIMKDEGWNAEVVSDFEYGVAQHIGFDGSQIVFNGPYKPYEDLKMAMENGSLVQIDNWDELALLEEVAEELGGTFDVGIRVWMATGYAPTWSKFGFAVANGEARRVAMRVINNKRLNLHTIHSHIGTYILNPETYSIAAQVLVGLRAELQADTGHLVPCLNFGGGFPSNSLLHGMVGPAEKVIPPIEDFAEAITSVLNKLPAKERPILRLESGRHLVDEAGYLVTTVVAVKGGQAAAMDGSGLTSLGTKESYILSDHAKVAYVLDTGVNMLFTAHWFAIGAYPNRDVSSQLLPTRLLGCLCMEIDVIREHIGLPRLQTGDHLTFHPVGAYNLAQSMEFISYRPAAILIGMDGKPRIIRRKEQLADVETPEAIPEYLQNK